MIVAVAPAPDPDAEAKIGPAPGNATLTSKTASAVPPPAVKLYDLTSPNPYALTEGAEIDPAAIVPNAEPDALLYFNASLCINVPLIEF